MPATMTHLERVLRAVRFEETDRIPLYDILENDAAIEYYSGQKVTPDNSARLKCRAVARCLDATRMVGGKAVPGTRWTDPDGNVWEAGDWTSWVVERPYHDLEGLTAWVKDKIGRLRATEHGAASREAMHGYIDQARGWMAEAAEDPGDLPVVVLESGVGTEICYHACGLELFTMLMFTDPGLLEEWLEETHQAELRRVAAIADPRKIPIALTYVDLASKNGPIFSPEWIREHVIPRLKRLVEAWHARDTICLYHSDGDLRPILDDLAGTGIDGLNPIETCAGMSIADVRARQPYLFMAGGIDVSQLLPLGTPEQVRARCAEAIEEAGGRGYLMGSTTEILPTVPLENVRAMLEFPLGNR